MTDFIEVVRQWMKSNEWDQDTLTIADDGSAHVRYESSGNGERYSAFLDIDPSKQWVELFHYLPGNVPQKRRIAVAELLAWINTNVKLGNFDLIMSDGRVRYRSGFDIEGGGLVVEMLENMEHANCVYADHYYAAIMAVAYANQTPEHALARLQDKKVTDTPKPEWQPGDDDLLDWHSFPATQCLQNWVADASLLVKDGGNDEDWKLLGHGLVIIHEDIERGQRMLQRMSLDAGFKFLHIPGDAVLDLPIGIADPFRSTAPAVVILEPGTWMLPIKDDNTDSDFAEKIESFRSRFIDKLNAFDPERPVIYATVVCSIDDMEEDLMAVGAFDRRFFIPEPPVEFLGNEFIDSIGRDKCSQDLLDVPIKVGKLISGHESKRTRDLAIQAMQRLAKRENRKPTFLDLVNFTTRGTIESDIAPPEAENVRRQEAYHEAGHALVAIIDSQGKNIPEFSSIVASNTFKGVVVESMSYHYSHESQKTYRDFVHNIRICLGGRAGEQLMVGGGNVSTGASADLESATRHCHNVFAHKGFAPGMDDETKAGTNLAVVCGGPSDSECVHVEALTRVFLEKEYQVVLNMLTERRDMLDAIAERLLWDPIVDQNELSEIFASFSNETMQ